MRRISMGRIALLVSLSAGLAISVSAQDRGDYGELLGLFGEFRAFLRADFDDDLAAYPEAMEQKAGELKGFQQHLAAIDVIHAISFSFLKRTAHPCPSSGTQFIRQSRISARRGKQLEQRDSDLEGWRGIP